MLKFSIVPPSFFFHSDYGLGFCKCDVLHEVDVIKVEEDLHKVIIENMKGREF